MRRALPYGLVGLAVLALFVDVAVGQASFFFRDLPAFHLPFQHLVAAALRAGELPLWNPALQLGMPLAADASAMPWYLPRWLLGLLDDERAVAWFVLGHLGLAGCGAVWLARGQRLGGPAATLAGLSYGLGGYLLGVHWNLLYLASAAWLPWLLGCADRLAQRPSTARAVPLAGCWSALVYVGDPQLALVAGPLLLGAVLLLATPAQRGPALRGLLVGGALAVGLAGLQALPTLGLLAVTARGQGLDLDEVLAWSLPPGQLLDLVRTPDLTARLVDEASLGWAPSLYPGLVAGALALLALHRPVDGARRLALAAVAGSGLLALGAHTPLYRWLLALLPGLDVFRYPHKLIVVGLLAWSLAAALGLEALADRRGRRAPWRAAILLGLLALLGWLPVTGDGGAPRHATLVALAGLGVLLLHGRGRVPAGAAAWLLVGVAALDLGVAQQGQRLVADRALLAQEPAAVSLVRALDDGGAPRLHVTPGLLARAERTRTAAAAGPVAWVARSAVDAARLLPNTGVARGLRYLHGYSPLQPLPAPPLASGARGAQLLDLLGVAATVDVTPPQLGPGDALLLARPDLGFALVANTDRWPRAYLLDATSAGPLLDATPGDATPLPLAPASGARVHLVVDRPAQVELEVQAPRPGWLILADRWDPDWQARVDGAPVEIRRALGLLRAVALPGGAHRVRFDYRPRHVRRGALLTAGSALLGVVLVVRARGRRRDQATPSPAPR